MNNRDVAIDIYNRLNRWSHGALTDFAVGIIEDELDMAFPEKVNEAGTTWGDLAKWQKNV